MKVKCIQNEKEYMRVIEGMGNGLVLLKICVVNKRVGQNFHLFFEDKTKPPLDIAINPDVGTIEYVSFFIQDEKVAACDVINHIEYKEGIATVEELFFDEDNTNISIEKKFKIVMNSNDIFVLCEEISSEPMNAYRLDDFNYLLFSLDSSFCGILLKNISQKEMGEIKKSKCM